MDSRFIDAHSHNPYSITGTANQYGDNRAIIQVDSWMGKFWKNDIVNKSWKIIQKHSGMTDVQQAGCDPAKLVNPDSSLFPRLIAYCSDQVTAVNFRFTVNL